MQCLTVTELVTVTAWNAMLVYDGFFSKDIAAVADVMNATWLKAGVFMHNMLLIATTAFFNSNKIICAMVFSNPTALERLHIQN